MTLHKMGMTDQTSFCMESISFSWIKGMAQLWQGRHSPRSPAVGCSDPAGSLAQVAQRDRPARRPGKVTLSLVGFRDPTLTNKIFLSTFVYVWTFTLNSGICSGIVNVWAKHGGVERLLCNRVDDAELAKSPFQHTLRQRHSTGIGWGTSMAGSLIIYCSINTIWQQCDSRINGGFHNWVK